jgi:hypothetical protein
VANKINIARRSYSTGGIAQGDRKTIGLLDGKYRSMAFVLDGGIAQGDKKLIACSMAISLDGVRTR